VQQDQRAIDDEARQLESLQQQKQNAVAAQRNVDLLNQAVEHYNAMQRVQEAEQKLAALPEGIAKLTGQEQARLDALKRKRAELQQKQRDQQQTLEQARRQQRDAGLPDDGVPDAALRTLRAATERLQEQAREIQRLQRECDQTQTKEQSTRARLGAAITDEQLAKLDAVTIPGLGEFARHAAHLRAKRAVIDEQRAQLGADDTSHDAAPDTDALRDGLAQLGRWLSTPAPADGQTSTGRAFWLLMTAATLLTLLALVAAFALHWVCWLLVPIGPALAWFGRPKHEPTSDARATYQHDYQRLGLDEPTAWTADDVSQRAASLARELTQRTQDEAKAQQRQRIEHEAAQLAQQQKQLDEQRRELTDTLGVDVGLEAEWLAVFCENLRDWQQHADQHRAAKDALDNANQIFDTELAQFNNTASSLGYEPVQTAEAARQTLDDINERQRRFEQAMRDAQGAERELRSLTNQIEQEVEAEYEALFEHIGLDVGEEAALAEWLDQLEEYRRLQRELHEARGARDSAAKALVDQPAMMDKPRSELDAEIERNRELAAMHDELTQRIADINIKIEHAKRSHELADKLGAHQAALDELADRCEQDSDAVIGALIADHVRESTADRARPAVFRRASALLTTITRGRLRLELDETDGASFLAYDENEQRAKQLDQLSTGERVQLLLSVRLGFAEHEERDAKLPLLMDETLGNADDHRAAAVIDAVLELARHGRQVFYFTAQPDEVSKWRQRLQAAGVDHREIDLHAIRWRAAAEAAPLVPTASGDALRQTPAEPDGMSHDAYGRAIHAPGLNPRAPVGQVHLWHFTDSPTTLHPLLQLGVYRWGQLHGLLQRGGASLLPNGLTRETLTARAAAVEAAFRAWRVGRGAPVDRAALSDSGAVSETFIDDLSALAERCEGDADAILDALEGKAVARWRSDKTDELRAYFDEHGYRDPRPRASMEEIRVDVLAVVAGALQRGDVTQAWVERLLAGLPG